MIYYHLLFQLSLVYICVIVEVGIFFTNSIIQIALNTKEIKKIIYFLGRNAFVKIYSNCIDDENMQMEKRVIDGNKCLRLIAISSLTPKKSTLVRLNS